MISRSTGKEDMIYADAKKRRLPENRPSASPIIIEADKSSSEFSRSMSRNPLHKVDELVNEILEHLPPSLKHASAASLLSHVRHHLEIRLHTKFNAKTWRYYKEPVMEVLKRRSVSVFNNSRPTHRYTGTLRRESTCNQSYFDDQTPTETEYSEFDEMPKPQEKKLQPRVSRLSINNIKIHNEMITRRSYSSHKRASSVDDLRTPFHKDTYYDEGSEAYSPDPDFIISNKTPEIPISTASDPILTRLIRLEAENRQLRSRVDVIDSQLVDQRLRELEERLAAQITRITYLDSKLEKMSMKYHNLKRFADEVGETNLNLIRGHRRLEKKNNVLSEVLQEVVEKLYSRIRKLDKEQKSIPNGHTDRSTSLLPSDPNTATTESEGFKTKLESEPAHPKSSSQLSSRTPPPSLNIRIGPREH